MSANKSSFVAVQFADNVRSYSGTGWFFVAVLFADAVRSYSVLIFTGQA